MTSTILTGMMFAGVIPFWRAWSANRGSSLTHAILWGGAAWAAWTVVFAFGSSDRVPLDPGRYAALCLVGCAGVAVLGARRPHVFAWDFVVLGLLSVLLLPLAESLLLGSHSSDGVRIYFLGGTLAVGVLNYVPTRSAPAALGMLVWCVGEMTVLHSPDRLSVWLDPSLVDALLGVLPWLAWLCLARGDGGTSPEDQLWRGFRDRFGMVWGQRMREQFNHAAEHAGWAVTLTWNGMVETGSTIAERDRPRILATLRATMQRFLAEN